MSPERRDCGFCLEGLVGGGLEGAGYCAEALLLDPFQRFSNPFSFCRS